MRMRACTCVRVSSRTYTCPLYARVIWPLRVLPAATWLGEGQPGSLNDFCLENVGCSPPPPPPLSLLLVPPAPIRHRHCRAEPSRIRASKMTCYRRAENYSRHRVPLVIPTSSNEIGAITMRRSFSGVSPLCVVCVRAFNVKWIFL